MIPSKWDKVTTRQYMKFAAAEESEGDSPMERVDALINKVCALSGITEEEACLLPLKSIEDGISKLKSKPIPSKIYETFNLNGVWFEFILNPKELSAERLAGVMEAAKLGGSQSIQQASFYLARPFKLSLLKRKYYELDASDVPDIIKDFGEIPITVSHPIAVFFLKLLKSSKDYSVAYSEKLMNQAKEMAEQAETDLQELMDGSRQ